MQGQNILIYRIGRVGDTVVALPALWAIRDAFPRAKIVLLTDAYKDNHAVAPQVLPNWNGLYDESMHYRRYDFRGISLMNSISLINRLRTYSFDMMFYLPPSDRSPFQVLRDKCFFRLLGIKELIGFYGQPKPYPRTTSGKLKTVRHETDYLLSLLRRDGISTNGMRMDLGIAEIERIRVDHWLSKLNAPKNRPWVAFGPGSRMPSKRWPLERFLEVGSLLIKEFGAFPIVFGGKDETELGQELVGKWCDGLNAAGNLSIREAAECIRRCILYVGNDTGTMHLAAAVGTRCVAIFSARENPGRWEPYGSGHIILRHRLPCEGCMQIKCPTEDTPCLTIISVNNVIEAIAKLFEQSM